MSTNPVTHTPPSALTQLYTAVSEGKLDNIRALLRAEKVEIDQRYTNGHTLLTLAARGGHPEIVRFFLQEAGAQVDRGKKATVGGMPARTSTTPLWHAASLGHTKAVTLLLEAGADASRCFIPRSPWPFDMTKAEPATTAVMLAASYNPAAASTRCAYPRLASRVIKTAQKMQRQWLRKGLARCMTDVHAEIHALFIAAIAHHSPQSTYDSPDTAKFIALLMQLPPEIQLIISQAATAHVVMAMLTEATKERNASLEKRWTWIAAAVQGRPLIERLQYFPINMQKRVWRWVLKANHPRPSPERIEAYLAAAATAGSGAGGVSS